MSKVKSDKLELIKLRYDKLYFERKGFKRDSLIDLHHNIEYGQNTDDDKIFIVVLSCKGNKEDEYTFEVAVSGIFKVLIDEKEKEVSTKKLIKYNAINILYPYLRAAITQLTSQSDVKPVILDPINVIEFVDGFTDVCEFNEKEENNNDKE